MTLAVRPLCASAFEPQLQRTAVVNRFSEDADPEGGTVTNIVAGIPGSGATGPGASDCGSCVAAVLEAARAVRGRRLERHAARVRRPEENGDLGRPRAEQSPLMRAVYVVLNWETEGSHGPSILLGANSSWLVREVLAGAPDARTYSVLPSLFRGLFGPQQLNRHAGALAAARGRSSSTSAGRPTTTRARRHRAARAGQPSAARRLCGRADPRARRRCADAPPGDRSTYFKVTGGVIVQYGPRSPERPRHCGATIPSPTPRFRRPVVRLVHLRVVRKPAGRQDPSACRGPYGLTRAASSALA